MFTWGCKCKVDVAVVMVNGKQYGVVFDGADLSCFLVTDADCSYTDTSIRSSGEIPNG